MSDDMLDQRTRHRLEDLQDIVKQDAKLIQNLRREIEKLRARSVLIPESIQKIIDDYPAVCAERDRMRKRLDKAHGFISRADWAQFFQEEHEDARDALEGVTEPASPWRDIESAPRDGNSIEVWDESPGAVNPAVVYWENGVWVYADNLLADAAPDGALPSHWRQRSEPPR